MGLNKALTSLSLVPTCFNKDLTGLNKAKIGLSLAPKALNKALTGLKKAPTCFKRAYQHPTRP